MKKKAAKPTHVRPAGDESSTPKTYRRDFVDNILGSAAAAFMMANAMGKLDGAFGRSMTWKRSLLTVSLHESGRIEVTGQWAEFLKRRFHEGEEIGIKLVSRLFGVSIPPRPPQTVDHKWGSTRLCHCPHCNEEQSAKHMFCQFYGGSIVPATFNCVLCGMEFSMISHKLLDGKLYCPSCYLVANKWV